MDVVPHKFTKPRHGETKTGIIGGLLLRYTAGDADADADATGAGADAGTGDEEDEGTFDI